ncbi:MAG: alpha-D-glucose phosphate-specific phosphoglucomutase [Gammaproteobacteria bacterium]|nr:alpha-D-glucose phosphate-specific phosphoglucomutase [Gammaproteobacteria bacterium]
MTINTITTSPFPDQKPGTSGLRKQVKVFQAPHYLANFIQSIFDSLTSAEKTTLVIGGDGRYYNREAIQVILRIAIANGYKHVYIGQHGLLSTPAVSVIIRKYKLNGGIILSASHNPGGPDGDFGVKYNVSNGGPAPETFTNKVFEHTKTIARYLIVEGDDIPLDDAGEYEIAGTRITVIDSVSDYADLMEHLFDFDKIHSMFNSGLFSMAFDAMHAVTGPYAREILVKRLGATEESIMNGTPLPDFGKGHPDPNLVYAADLVALMNQKLQSPDLGAASDGDGDRNMILGRQFFVTPSDSLAVMAANAHLLPGYRHGVCGIARSMPTSMAADHVARRMGIKCYETPTGWKFFGNLLDAGLINLCGEESFGTGSDHIREKDGLWAVLFWLNLIAEKKQSVANIVHQHWQGFGRNYYSRHDYENIDMTAAQAMLSDIQTLLPTLSGRAWGDNLVMAADNFSYRDPVDGSLSENQGIRILFENESRIIVRMSGTGTQGATLRLYFEQYQPPAGQLDADTQTWLAPLFAIVEELIQVKQRSGRSAPDVIT